MAQQPITIRDDLGDELVLDAPPTRIVSLVPSVTETVIDLGAAQRLVGITNYCVKPAATVAEITKVGGTKGFSLETIASLKPDLILANKEENRKHHIEQLRRDYPVFVTYPRNVEDAMKMILDLGTLTGTAIQASEFAASCDHLLDGMDLVVIGRRLRTACMIWRDPWMAAGPDSYMSALLDRLGFANVFDASAGRYPETTLQAVLDTEPDVIILPDEPYEFGAADDGEVTALIRRRGVSTRTLLADGSYLTWFGTRTILGLRFLYETKTRLLRG